MVLSSLFCMLRGPVPLLVRKLALAINGERFRRLKLALRAKADRDHPRPFCQEALSHGPILDEGLSVSLGRFGREGRVLCRHVPVQVLKCAVAAWTHAMADPVLNLGHLASGCGGATVSGFRELTLMTDLIITFGDPLRQPIALAAHFIEIGFPGSEHHRVAVAAIKAYLGCATLCGMEQLVRDPHVAFAIDAGSSAEHRHLHKPRYAAGCRSSITLAQIRTATRAISRFVHSYSEPSHHGKSTT
jgi:hypothetical protein